MATTQPPVAPDRDARAAAALRRANVRTGLVLLTIAAVFFFGIIGARLAGGMDEGVSLLAIAVILFLVIAIGRNVRSRT